MIGIGIAVVLGILILCSTVASFWIIFLLFREKGIGHALLGFFFFPYAIVWGWMNAKRLEIFDIMVFGTVTTLMAIGFSMLFAAQAAAKVEQAFTEAMAAEGFDFESEGFDTVTTTTSEDGTVTTTTTSEDGIIVKSSNSNSPAFAGRALPMGSINMGGNVTGELTDSFELHSWTFDGNAGQTVTIQVNAANGTDPDPRVYLMAPDGEYLINDDDGGGESNALISSFVLPSDGQYTIQVNGWSIGEYELVIN